MENYPGETEERIAAREERDAHEIDKGEMEREERMLEEAREKEEPK